jgi:hypothetical protein
LSTDPKSCDKKHCKERDDGEHDEEKRGWGVKECKGTGYELYGLAKVSHCIRAGKIDLLLHCHKRDQVLPQTNFRTTRHVIAPYRNSASPIRIQTVSKYPATKIDDQGCDKTFPPFYPDPRTETFNGRLVLPSFRLGEANVAILQFTSSFASEKLGDCNNTAKMTSGL